MRQTIYTGIFSIISIASSGFPSGIIALIFSILAARGLKKVDTAYKHYQATGQFPPAPIA